MALFDRSETKAFANCVSTTRQWRFRNASSAKQWSFMRSPTRHNGRHDGVRDDRYFMDRSRPCVFRFHKFRQKSFDEISPRFAICNNIEHLCFNYSRQSSKLKKKIISYFFKIFRFFTTKNITRYAISFTRFYRFSK